MRRARRNTHRLENAPVRLIRDPILEGYVDRVPRPLSPPPVLALACPGEELAVLVEGVGHDAVGRPERLLDAVAVVAVDIDVEHAGDGAEELEDAEDDVVNVAEARGFALLCVVEATGPVDGNVGLAFHESLCCGWRVAGRVRWRWEGEAAM